MRGNVEDWRRYDGESIDREVKIRRKTLLTMFKENFIAGLGWGLGFGTGLMITLLIRGHLLD